MNHPTLQSVLSRCFLEENKTKVAIECGETFLSYGQLANSVNTIADKLSAKGVKTGSQVAVFSENRILVIATALASIKLRAVFVPFDTEFPVDRIRRLCETADIDVVIVDQFSAENFPEEQSMDRLSISLSEILQNGQESVLSFANDSEPEDAAYLYFTSGTTGEPKGILGNNKGLAHFVNWEVSELGLKEGVRVSQITSPAHDPFLRDVFTPLASLGTICIPNPSKIVLSPFEFRRWLNTSRIELLHCTPTVFRNLCNSGEFDDNDFVELKWVLLAGEKVLSKDLDKWYKAFGDRVQIINLYGPTETTLAKLFYRVSPNDLEHPVVPIGRPIDRTVVHIMNNDMKPCDQQERGELYIGTQYRTHGYYKDSALTNSVFVADPLGTNQPGDDLFYKTGDIVVQRPDANIVFVERTDRQLKIRGKRVELGEIESELLTYPGIQDSVVLVSEADDAENSKLRAFYVSPSELDNEQLMDHLKKQLPDYLMPSSFQWLESLPFNLNGKLDIDRLIAENGQTNGAVIQQVTEGGEDDTIHQLVNIWKEILEKEDIGLQDSFMEVGGDSLGIMQLIARVHSDFEFELSLWQIFEDLTIEKLAALIDEHRNN